ncbi:MAG: thioesterase [Thermoanaerobaculia bacterium]|nr:thioesterase [Thermoanaerobaculia bacterium]
MPARETAPRRRSRPWTARRERTGERLAAGGAAAALELCDLFQEAAVEHAERLGCSIAALNQLGLTWVLLRLDVEVEPAAVWRGPLVVTTWPSAARGLFALRDFEAAGDAGPIARATSAWCALDLATRRPARLPSSVRAIQPPHRPRALERRFRRPPAPDRPERSLRLRVAEADLDVNRHVNHVRYLRWALTSLPEEWREGAGFAGLEAEFLAETSLGEELVADVARRPADGGGTEARHLVATAGGRAVARVLTRWRRPAAP